MHYSSSKPKIQQDALLGISKRSTFGGGGEGGPQMRHYFNKSITSLNPNMDMLITEAEFDKKGTSG